jgi:hypothetical protein
MIKKKRNSKKKANKLQIKALVIHITVTRMLIDFRLLKTVNQA